MDTNVQNPETKREVRYRVEERWVADGTVAVAFSLGGVDADGAWDWLNNYRQVHPWRYTPHGSRRLVLLAVGGAK